MTLMMLLVLYMNFKVVPTCCKFVKIKLVHNPLVPGVHQKVTHTLTSLQLSTAGLFKYVWPFSGHQALKP